MSIRRRVTQDVCVLKAANYRCSLRLHLLIISSTSFLFLFLCVTESNTDYMVCATLASTRNLQHWSRLMAIGKSKNVFYVYKYSFLYLRMWVVICYSFIWCLLIDVPLGRSLARQCMRASSWASLLLVLSHGVILCMCCIVEHGEKSITSLQIWWLVFGKNYGLKRFSQFCMNLLVPQFIYKTTTGQNKIARQSRLDSKTKRFLESGKRW
jgi:hypothetical protein